VWARLGLQTAGAGADDDGNAGHDNAGTVEVDLKGHAPDAVLAEVVRAGARPRAFAPLPQTLEALYLAVTRQPAPESAARPAPAATVTLTPRCAPAWITGCARTVRYELARLARTPTLLIFALPAALTALRVWSRRAEVARDLARVRARELFSATDSSGYDAVGVAMQQATPLLAFLLLGLASQSYASELAQGTLRNLLLRPIARGGVWLGKLAAQMLAAVAAFALAAGTALALAATLIGFGDAAEVTRHGDRTPLIAEADIAPHLLPALAHTLPALLSYVALGLCIGALTRRPAVALGLALALGVGLDVGRGLVPETWLPSAALPSPLRDTSHLRAFTDLAFGRADALFPDDARAAVVALLWSMGAVVVGLIVCKRRAVP
jgi:ABC-2 type transport system permease protein